MTKRLLLLALIFIPFLVNPLTILPFISTIDGGTRPPKEFISLIFSLAIFLYALFNGEIKSFKNKWFLIFLFYIPFSIINSPPFITLLGQHNIAGSWQWKPFTYILIYTLLIITISNIDFNKIERRRIFSIVTIIGVLISLYIFIQGLDLDQIFKVKSIDLIGLPMNPRLIGTMGNSTLISAFLVICLPFCYYMKKWGRASILICAILLCNSIMSTGAMVVSASLYSFMLWPKCRPYLGALGMVAMLGLTYFYASDTAQTKAYITSQSNGRVGIWKSILEDIKSAPINQDINTPGLSPEQIQYLTAQNDRIYSMTGIGGGSFKIMFSEKHKEIVNQEGRLSIKYPKWGTPHNLYIHIAYCFGIIGLGLFIRIYGGVIEQSLFIPPHLPYPGVGSLLTQSHII